MRRFLQSLLILFALAVPPSTAPAQSLVGIAATVNDDVITLLDVATRTNLILFGAGLAKTPEMQAILQPHVMRILIDERLKLQAAKAFGTSIPESVVDERLAYVASRNNMTIQQFEQMLYSGGILIETLRNQIRAELAWTETVAARFSSSLRVAATDIDAQVRRMESSDQAQVLLAELLVAVDRPGEDSKNRSAAESLLSIARQGVPLTLLAQQFSQAPSALNDGITGWVYPDQLDSDVRAAIGDLPPNGLAGPIRTTHGYLLVQVLDRRDGSSTKEPQFRLARMVLPVAATADETTVAEAHSLAESIRLQVSGCDQFAAFGRQIDPVVNANPNIGVGTISQLPPDIRPLFANAEVGIATASHRTAQGFELFMICEELTPGAAVADRDQIAERLRNEALNEAAKNYLSTLRSSAIIEIRG